MGTLRENAWPMIKLGLVLFILSLGIVAQSSYSDDDDDDGGSDTETAWSIGPKTQL